MGSIVILSGPALFRIPSCDHALQISYHYLCRGNYRLMGWGKYVSGCCSQLRGPGSGALLLGVLRRQDSPHRPSASKTKYPTRDCLPSLHYNYEYLVQTPGTSDTRRYMGINERYSEYYRCPHDVWYWQGKHVTRPVALSLLDLRRLDLRDWSTLHFLDAPRYDYCLVSESTGARSGDPAHGNRSRYSGPCSIQQSSTQGGTLVTNDIDLLSDGYLYHPHHPHNEGMPASAYLNVQGINLLSSHPKVQLHRHTWLRLLNIQDNARRNTGWSIQLHHRLDRRHHPPHSAWNTSIHRHWSLHRTSPRINIAHDASIFRRCGLGNSGGDLAWRMQLFVDK